MAPLPVLAQTAPAADKPITDAKSWHAALLRQVGVHSQFPDLPLPPVKKGETPPPLPSAQVMVKFVLDRDGRVLSASVVNSSGKAEFDQAALDGLKRAEPLPKPPAALPGQNFTLQLPVRFVGGPRIQDNSQDPASQAK